MAVLSDGPGRAQAPIPMMRGLGQRAGTVTQYAGAALSVALMVGVSVWGYKLLVRDVNGIPVVRALEGPMRSAPDNPGGEVVANTGLAVNAIAAVGEAAPPEDVLTLAPAGEELTDEDMEVAFAADEGELAPAAEAGDDALIVAEAAAPVPAPDAALTPEQVLALADQIAAGADPLTALEPGATTDPLLSVEGEAVTDTAQFTVIPADVPGVAVSLRPMPRPAGTLAATQQVAAETAAPSAPATVSAAVPAGTPMAQLGAYDSVEVAATEWDRFATRFSEFLSGKERVIQEAQSGGRTFYRLRAMGFADLADARRFCAALAAEGADCTPVAER